MQRKELRGLSLPLQVGWSSHPNPQDQRRRPAHLLVLRGIRLTACPSRKPLRSQQWAKEVRSLFLCHSNSNNSRLSLSLSLNHSSNNILQFRRPCHLQRPL